MESEERPAKVRKLDHVPRPAHNDDPTGRQTDGQDVTTERTSQEQPPQEQIGVSPCAPASKQSPDANQVPSVQPGDGVASLSKNQQKKLKRRQEWEAQQPLRKAKKKELRKAKKARDRLRRANEDPAAKEARTAARRDGCVLPVTVIFDCGYDDLMFDKEIVSLGSQLTRCYSENKNARFKTHLRVSSFGGRLKYRFDTVLKGSHKSWAGVTFSEESFDVVAEQAKESMQSQRGQSLGGAFAAEHIGPVKLPGTDADSADVEPLAGETIYLSSDSDYTLTELKPYSTYVIGGLVDRNRYKGKCHRSAEERGMRTARLPIGEYLEMSTRHILTTNHVLEIMLKWLELRDWGAAFTAVIPKRKGGLLKDGHAAKPALEETDCVIDESGGDSDAGSEESGSHADTATDNTAVDAATTEEKTPEG